MQASAFHTAQRHTRGFTLVEMLVVVSILAIVTAISAPSFRSFTAGQQIKSAAYDLTSALLLARSEALKRNGSVEIRRVGDRWNNGWRVAFVPTDATLNLQNAVNGDLSFDGAPDVIVFNAYGRVSSPVDQVEIELSSSAAAGNKRCISLSLSGHANSTVGACP
jgi:type IV fimbrial biogenesis protein FimT